MNAAEGFVFSNKEKNFQNENGGIEPQHVMINNIHLGVSQSRENSKVCEISKIQMCKESVSKRSRLSPELIHREKNLGSTSKEPKGALGLKFTVTPSFISKVNKMCLPIEKKPRKENESLSSRHAKTKAKADERASNFLAIYIKIGAWQRTARHEGELVAKLYYAKRRLVWEVLEGPLKRKMEIQWSDICAIRATTLENELGLLEIELNQPPVYYRETCPQPRKHTIWKQSSDFTCGQAPIWRRHQVTFPPGILEKNYERLLRYDKELDALSKKPFPRHECPYFDPTLFTLDFNGYGAYQAAQYPYWACPTILQGEPFPMETPDPSLSVLDLPFTYQGGGNNSFVAQTQTSWLQSFGIPRDIIFGINWTFGISSTTTNINNVYDTPFSSTMNVNSVCNPSFPLATNNLNIYDPSHCGPHTFGLLTYIQADLLDNAQLDDARVETVGSISSMLEPIVTVNNMNESSYQPNLHFRAITEDRVNNNYDSNGMILDPNHRLAAQDPKVSSENVFQGSYRDVFQGLSENMFQGTNDNMLSGANDNMFELAGNTPKHIGVEDFF